MSSKEWRCNNVYVATFLALVFLFQFSCFSEKAPYSSFAHDAKTAPAAEWYDYIVVGGGTAGCALAATLSENAKVLLLERGGLPYGNPSISNVGGFFATLSDNSPSSPAQLFISTDGVYNHRARVLGGGTALNAGFYSRANPEFLSKTGWDSTLVKESYEWVENKLVFEPKVLGWQSALKNGLLEAGVLPDNGFTLEHLVGTKVGGSIFDQNGHRHTAADLLEYAVPSNIIVYLHATAQQILFDPQGVVGSPRANGVVFTDSSGIKHWAYLKEGYKNEVILCSGALGSPQLLMLSGIGPAQQLTSFGIQVVMDQPMVGQGMSDNPFNVIVIPSPLPVEISLVQVVGITPVGSYIEAASEYVDWIRNLNTKIETDMHASPLLEFLNLTVPAAIPSEMADIANANVNVGVIGEKVKGPLSTGYLELHSKDPNENPKVTFNYFKDPKDLQICVEGLEIIKRVIDSTSFASYRYPFTTAQALIEAQVTLPLNLRPKRLTSAFSLDHFCEDTVMTIWHYHGGCQVGKVVDNDYRVMGVENLRVVDGSTFLESPGTNPQATVMMFGRYTGQRILRERVSPAT